MFVILTYVLCQLSLAMSPSINIFFTVINCTYFNNVSHDVLQAIFYPFNNSNIPEHICLVLKSDLFSEKIYYKKNIYRNRLYCIIRVTLHKVTFNIYVAFHKIRCYFAF